MLSTYYYNNISQPDGRVVQGVATDCWRTLTTAQVQIPGSGACEKVASDLGLGGGLSPLQ